MNKFRAIYPSVLLAPYVKQYWFITMDNIVQGSQRLVPLGCTALSFHRGNRIYSSAGNDYLPLSYLYGMANRHTNLTFSGHVDFICIIFQPAGAKAFFKIPINELSNSYISLDTLNDSDLIQLEQRLSESTDAPICVELIEQFLINRLYLLNSDEDRRIKAVLQSICYREGDVNRLAATACLSYKQFKRIFTENIGINPKEFLQITRFQKLHHLLQLHTEMTLAQLADECGYYDKSHLIKEVREFSGFTPGELTKACEPVYSDYHSLFRSAFIDLS
ncbi:helix-turn-helix domain-containing protein [uncultured Bacteroides sp.]|jgi:AraC-like DNA-binding protein|uniref:helix-turn-helix domain-containing protein n=1 Tax=uncultured Bacteroides sp. TaxID=162156 RepID=UPI00338FFAC0